MPNKPDDRPQRLPLDDKKKKPSIASFVKPEMDLYVDTSLPPERQGDKNSHEVTCQCDLVCNCNQVAVCTCNKVPVVRGGTVCSCNTVPVCNCEKVMRCTCNLVKVCSCNTVPLCGCDNYSGGTSGGSVCMCVPVIH